MTQTILSRIKKLFGRNQWTKRERSIFSFWDGSQWRRVDPIEIQIKLLPVSAELDVMLGRANISVPQAAKDRAEATKDAIAVVRQIFQLEPYSYENGVEKGVPADECFNILEQYGLFMQGLKKNTQPSPSVAPSTEVDFLADRSPTKNTLDWSLTDANPLDYAPSPSPLG